MTLPLPSFRPASPAPRAPLGGSYPAAPAPQPQPGYAVYAPQSQPSVASVVDGVLGAIGRVFEGILNFFKRLFNARTAGPAGPVGTPGPIYPAPGPIVPQPAAPTFNGLTANELALAQQQGILATRDNLDAFLREAQTLEATHALGPGSNTPDAIAELQQALQRLGFRVAPSGAWDQATTDAVLAFKRSQGLVGSYRLADGIPAVHPFIDEPTKQALIRSLQQAAATPPQPVVSLPPSPTTLPPTSVPAQPTPGPGVATLPAPGPAPITPSPAPVAPPPAPVTPPPAPVTPPPAPVTPPPAPVAPPPAPVTPPPAPVTPTPTPVTPAPAPVTPSPTQPTPGTPGTPDLTADEQALAQQHGLLPTRANMTAFLQEAQALEAADALGPGSSQADMVMELQQLLAAWGHAVTPSGQWDEATTQAVTTFKRDNGLVASYKAADGQPAVHPFIDAATKQAMIRKLETGAVSPTPAAPPAPAPASPLPSAPAPTTLAVPSLTAEEARLAQQHNLLPTRDNVAAFAAEAQRLEATRALGPGSAQADMVRELQQVLTQLGFVAPVTGAFDAATEAAVVAFKRANQLVAPYKQGDGAAAVHPFIDEATTQALIRRLGGA
ncbi:MAG: peptidoglycan-binding domain-containing protein [Candidatus Sericytochromatia bacterium]|nr:peptidoglycan-binding domain-containing protein [Candidatus Sericytochromatia bacterium]